MKTTVTCKVAEFGRKRDRKTGQPKSYQLSVTDAHGEFKFWVQRRSIKGLPEIGDQVEISQAVYDRARDERAEFVADVKTERARAKTLIELPAADWTGPCKWDSAKTCAGYDVIAETAARHSSLVRDKRVRVFLTLAADGQITVGDAERALAKALEKAGCAHAYAGALLDAINAA